MIVGSTIIIEIYILQVLEGSEIAVQVGVSNARRSTLECVAAHS
jgi:hypothetical protein